MYRYRIAHINLEIVWDDINEAAKRYGFQDCTILPRSLAAFSCEDASHAADMRVRIHKLAPYIEPAPSKKIHNQSFFRDDTKMVLTVYNPFNYTVPGYSIRMTQDYSVIDYTPHIKEYEHFDLQWVTYPFEGRALYAGGIVLHGAAVEYNGHGIIFTGISGAGKSTQAHLWQKHKDALIINGDCPYVKLQDGVVKFYGTPWCGSSGEYINRSTTLRTIVLVKQGQKNEIREITGTAAFLAVLSNVLRSNFDENTLDLAIGNLETIIKHVRVLELTCTISKDAVEILEKEIL